jgi:hypothetical protein
LSKPLQLEGRGLGQKKRSARELKDFLSLVFDGTLGFRRAAELLKWQTLGRKSRSPKVQIPQIDAQLTCGS